MKLFLVADAAYGDGGSSSQFRLFTELSDAINKFDELKEDSEEYEGGEVSIELHEIETDGMVTLDVRGDDDAQLYVQYNNKALENPMSHFYSVLEIE